MDGTNKGMEAQLLLVHSPLVGCGTWEPVAKDLAGDGYVVTVPDLAGTVTAGPPYHPCQALVIADSAGGQPAVLIGHSGAGPLLATAGMMLGEGVRGYIFVDAGLPTPGRSWMETVPPELAAHRGTIVRQRVESRFYVLQDSGSSRALGGVVCCVRAVGEFAQRDRRDEESEWLAVQRERIGAPFRSPRVTVPESATNCRTLTGTGLGGGVIMPSVDPSVPPTRSVGSAGRRPRGDLAPTR
jgi:pimeloyl-ACP methyl ester carboxylesterase